MAYRQPYRLAMPHEHETRRALLLLSDQPPKVDTMKSANITDDRFTASWGGEQNAPKTAVALTFDDTQRNAPRSPLFTPAMLAALLTDAEKAHKAYIAETPADMVAYENDHWAKWYAAYMTPRLNAAASAALWTPTPTLDVPPFAPIVLSDREADDIAPTATVDIQALLNRAAGLSNRNGAFAREEATERAARQDGNELRPSERLTDVDA